MTNKSRLTRRQRETQTFGSLQNPGHEMKDFKICCTATLTAAGKQHSMSGKHPAGPK